MADTTVTRAAALAKSGGQLAEQGRADESLFQELADWLMEALEHSAEGELTQALALAKADSPATERYLTRTMRVVAGAQEVHVVEGQTDWLHLLAIPLFFQPRQHTDVSEVLTHLECRSEIERSLETALGLGFASVRLCEHPVSAIELENLGMAETRRVALDLLQQGDSAYLTPPVLDVGASPEAAHHLSLLWPAVWKVSEQQREAQIQRIAGSLHRSKALSQFKHRADELIERELQKRWNIGVRADIYMPALHHDVLPVFRLVELNVMLNHALHQFKTQCNSVSFGLYGNKLRYSLLDMTGKVLTSDELRAPEESLSTISSAVRAACARHGVACTAKLPR